MSIIKKKKEDKKIGTITHQHSADEHSYSDTIKWR